MKMDLLSLPVVMVENIFSYLSYDEIARLRVVCKGFNQICMQMLNRGFLIVERRHSVALKSLKAQLPRRESERRQHPLSPHCDILTSIETRISMLNMTYSKYIHSNICCFIPGKVIDEIKRVLIEIETSKTTPRAHEVLQELRDISSMAIEHFDDKISPAFRKKLQECVSSLQSRPTHAVLTPLVMRQELLNLRRYTKLNAKLSLYLAEQYRGFFKKMLTYKKTAFKQRKCIQELQKKQRHQDASIADLKKRIEECDIKYSELTHTNQAVGGNVKANLKNRIEECDIQHSELTHTNQGIGAKVKADLKKRIEECDIKLNELTHTNQAVGGKVKALTANDSSAKGLRHFGSQIKLDLSVLPIGTSKRNQANSSTANDSSAQGLRHFGSQIKLDLSVLPIGTSKRNQANLPNIKPRKSLIRLTSMSNNDTESPTFDPEPSTSGERDVEPLKSRSQISQTNFAEIENLTKELQQLSNITLPVKIKGMSLKSSSLKKSPNITVQSNISMRNVPEVRILSKVNKKRKTIATDTDQLTDIKKQKLD